MKITISVNKLHLETDVDPESMEFESIENTGVQAGDNAGISTVRLYWEDRLSSLTVRLQ